MSDAQEILDLQTELAGLRGEESAQAFAQELMDSIDQAQQVLASSAEDAEGAVENLEEVQKALDKVNEALGATSKFLGETAKAVGAVADGVGKLKDKASDVKKVLDKIDGAMKEVQKLRGLSGDPATVQIQALGKIIKDITGWLGDLIDFIPGLGAFIEIWLLAIESLASSAATLESIVIKRNREAREAGLPEPYVIIQVGATARANRIQEITSRLEELGVDMSPPSQTTTGEPIPLDVRNSISVGLRDCGMTYDEFTRGSQAAGAARLEVNRLNEEVASARATVFAGTRDGIPQGEVDAAEARLPDLKEDLAEAIDDYESKAAVIQPCFDGMFGCMERYVDEGIRDKWGEWMHSQYDPSYFLGPAGIEQIRSDAGITPELQIPESMSGMAEEETPVKAKGLLANKKVLYIGGGGILAMSMLLVVLVILPSDSKSPPENVQTVTPPVLQQETPPASDPAETPDEPQTEPSDTPAEPEQPVSAVTPPKTAEEPVAALPDCPPDFKHDITGKRLSGTDGEVPETPADSDDARASNITCTRFETGSFVFTVIVEGDGESLAKADGTVYDVRFVVNNEWPTNIFEDDTGFEVTIAWNRPFEVFTGNVSDSERTRIQDASVEVVWLDPSTLQATVDIPGHDVEVRNMRVELNVLTQDSDERTTGQYRDIAIWEPDQ